MALDLKQYALVADVWEGSGDINEAILKAAGVEGLIVRMNTSWGGLQYDNTFLTQWAQASGFARAAYVVVSPVNTDRDLTAKMYVDWILAKKPADCKIIALDVEVDAAAIYHRPDITPAKYSELLTGTFAGLHAAGVTCIQYSGAWFYNLVAPWVKPDYVNQWWARYMNSVYPTAVINGVLTATHPSITWEELKVKLAALSWTPLVTSLTEAQTGRIVIWQVASSYVLPGCPAGKPVDVNLMSRADFTRIFGAAPVVIPPPVVVPPPVVIPPVLLTDAQVDAQLRSDWRKAHPGQ
jgi:hypothetical protein